MGRKRHDETKPKLPTDIIRLPVKMTRKQREMMHEMAYIWHGLPIEEIAGEWLVERIEAEYKLGRKAATEKAAKRKG